MTRAAYCGLDAQASQLLLLASIAAGRTSLVDTKEGAYIQVKTDNDRNEGLKLILERIFSCHDCTPTTTRAQAAHGHSIGHHTHGRIAVQEASQCCISTFS